MCTLSKEKQCVTKARGKSWKNQRVTKSQVKSRSLLFLLAVRPGGERFVHSDVASWQRAGEKLVHGASQQVSSPPRVVCVQSTHPRSPARGERGVSGGCRAQWSGKVARCGSLDAVVRNWRTELGRRRVLSRSSRVNMVGHDTSTSDSLLDIDFVVMTKAEGIAPRTPPAK